MKMYIAVLDEVPDHMVPVLVAHSVINAHMVFKKAAFPTAKKMYKKWLKDSFKKVVVRVNQKEFDKIKTSIYCFAGHENTTLNGEHSCLVCIPMENEHRPKVLQHAKLWSPKD